jgi:DNA-directed RNA polymerase subunit RPC12/RpoP
MDDSDSLRWKPVTRAAAGHEEERRSTRSGRLGTGTLACSRCDAPVALAGKAAPTDILRCPFCSHRAPLKEFLSLALPSRPARVEVRVHAPRVARVSSRATARARYSGSPSATE